MGRVVTGLACVLVVAGIVAMWFAEPSGVPTAVARSATLLYYNSPAAVQTDDGIAVGFIRMDGSVGVVTVTPDGKVADEQVVHQFDGPDDHAAPALWPTPQGLLVATAHHSSDLFLYRIEGNAARLVCRWPGRYTYPRFDDDGTGLRLYIRTERGHAENSSGALSFLTPDAKCADPVTLYGAPPANWLYVPPPVRGRMAWSVYNQHTMINSGLWLDGMPVGYDKSPYQENLAWSVGGMYTAVTRFTGAFRCCLSGRETYDLIGPEGWIVFTSEERRSIYYPGGIVIDRQGTEALFPLRGQVVRRTLPDRQPMPSCDIQAEAAYSQYVMGGAGSYVFVRVRRPTDERDFSRSTIYLCQPAAL